MLEGLRGRAALDGFRGMPGVSIPALAEIVARLGEFAADHADAIEEIDINPLICDGERILAVDALIVRRDRG
jgi:acetyl-CoA synthetase